MAKKKINNYNELKKLLSMLNGKGWELELNEDCFVVTNLNSKINAVVFIENEEQMANQELNYNVFMDDVFFEMDIEQTLRQLRAQYTWQELNELFQSEYQQALEIKKLIADWYKGE